mmetsp:Transcript_6363/g.16982  ORF Transcript_6363/g.16982 Transcript_6363/m.16982 type:complete len:169 (-) Transcript_6363:227-733(-)|eukprot:CAMPEP_0185836470 /NCGR_PEP_ID=MMETSP1353-20130828/9795_1 /TAXON_ID=1077150 /ORGANISM="Erythrolobus australicus, Strain CCMP3124" /LENGTH=168 /DNA_ID=CAMNT_0028535265 /DNA_START=591 /DNA_END=1097 /DNA_ORIENTATION=-
MVVQRAEGLEGSLGELRRTGEKLGQRLVPGVDAFEACVGKMFEVIDAAKTTPQPSDETTLSALVEPLMQEMEIVSEMKDGVGSNDLLEAHVVTLGDAVLAFGWVTEFDDPVTYISGIVETTGKSSASLKAKSERGDTVHAEFADAVMTILEEILLLVKTNYPKGLAFK